MHQSRTIIVLLSLLLLNACGGGSSSGGGSEDPNSFAKSIILKNGESVQGTPPPASNSADAPQLIGNPSAVVASITDPVQQVIKIPTIIRSGSKISKLYMQISGASDQFFEITPSSASNTTQQTGSGLRVDYKEVIEVTVPIDLSQELLDQQFCALISAQDDTGLISNPTETCLEVSKTKKPNTAPIADAGPNLGVKTDVQTELDGADSTDPDGDLITYSWSLTQKPSGSNAALQNATAPIAAFIPDIDGSYEVQLVVTDSKGVDSHPASIAIDASPANTTPIANAGPDLNTLTGTEVSLDGSASADTDGDTLSFNWVLFSLPDGSTASLNNTSASTPSFTPDVDGQYVLALVVNDGKVDSEPDTVIVTASTTNLAPTANAGEDVPSAPLGTPVSLNGTQSSDPNRDQLTYRWSLNARPANSLAQLSNPTSATPTITPDVVGDYVIQLVVNDSTLDSDPVSIVLTAVDSSNNAPLANAGVDQTATIGQTVQLNGDQSSDPENSTLSFQWTLKSRPATSTASLSNPTTVNPTFVADVEGDYIAELVVNDGPVASLPDSVTISVSATPTNQAPTANAGQNQTGVVVGTVVTLDGSQSADPEGETLTFQWAFQSIPATSQAILVNETTVNPSFTADVAGQYVVQLVVTDTAGQASQPASVSITTQSSP
jgi:hypothetical protein